MVWLDPAHEATDRLYRAAVPLRETLGPVVVVISLDPAVPADVVAANLAGASCAYEQTALVDPGWATGRVAARLGLPVEPTLEAVLAARRLDRTAPIEVLGPARGLDVLCAADAVDLGGGDAEPRLWPLDSVIHDLAARAGLVLVLGPSLADFEPAQWAGVADGVLLVGPATAGLDPAVMRRFDGGPPLGWLATDCATSAAPKA
ncbi:MAG: hypothetical protein H6740_23520 [Alphaproteobacteria bacterium]|nr:hypothetical protein [Alphaproteobacteria bacterium]